MARRYTDETKFWVIFDTATRPTYYRDVHNVLAAPRGTILRYDYKAEYISDQSLAAITSKQDPLPGRVLLAYGQHLEYHRGGGDHKHIEDFNHALWIGTRLARMVLVAEHAGEYFLDFEVLGYPAWCASGMDILRRQFEQGEAPFQKWVGFSSETERFAALTAGTADDNWAIVVATLSASPSQFAGDAFWRVVSVRKSGGGGRIQAVERSEREGSEVRQVRSHLRLLENALYSAEIATKRSQQSRTGGAPVEFKIQIQPDNQDLVRVVGAGAIDVRQYTRDHVELECAGLSFLVSRAAELTLNTLPRDDDWPQGPELRLRVQLEKKWGITLLSLSTLAAAAVLGSISLWKLWTGTAEALLASVGAAAGVILLAIGATLWTGKLTSK